MKLILQFIKTIFTLLVAIEEAKDMKLTKLIL